MFDTKTSVLRLRAIGLTTDQSRSLCQLVQKWVDCSGEEWTVERIKSIKVDLLRHFAGLSPTKSHSWIHYGPKGPKGPFGVLFRLPRKEFRRAWNAVMIYTGLVYHHPDIKVTPRQWKKLEMSVKRQPLQPDALVESIRLVHWTSFYVPIKVRSDTGYPLIDYQASPSRRSPKGFTTVPEIEGVIDSLRPLIRRTFWSLRNWDILKGTVEGLESHIVPALEINLEEEQRQGGELLDEDYFPEMGLVSLIQEAGYKLRFAANPYRCYQMALKPLGDATFDALKRVPNDFTFDQESGVRLVQRWLSNGLPAASMDLSNATDNAPLDAQLELLSRFGVSTRWLQFFRDCCRGDWWVNRRGHVYDPLKWTVGSPLGLYPTFASFALWHHSVVVAAFEQLEKEKIDGLYPYAIVGDDVVIMDWDVARLYEQKMESWGVPISESKTLWSEQTAEFVGRVITPKEVIQGYKWKGRVSDDSFVEFCRNIGPGALILMRPRQRRVLSYIADLPYPYGLGWNPLGIPLEERLTPEIERIWSRDERVRTFSRRAARAYQLIYSSSDLSGTPVPGLESDAESLASDQLADEVTAQLLPGWESGEWIWGNLLDVALFQGVHQETLAKIHLMLQRTSYVERRKEVPTLVVLERKIRSVLSRSR